MSVNGNEAVKAVRVEAAESDASAVHGANGVAAAGGGARGGAATAAAAAAAKNSARVRKERIAKVRLLWEGRRTLLKAFVIGAVLSVGFALILPKGFEATTKLMPPESGGGNGAALMAALATRGAGMLGSLAGEMLGVKGNGAVFVEILESRTVADRLIEKFQLDRVYKTNKIEYTRKELEHHTKILEDRKSGVITITVIDTDPERAAGIAQAYVAELDRLVAQVSTSSARRERIFLEERLATVKTDLDNAATQFSQFASKNTAIDIPAQGKAMVEAAATLQGQLIAAEAEASGLERIYTVNNVRVKALQARIGELREQLQKLGGSTSPNEAINDDALYPSIRKLPLLGVKYADLYRRTKIEETVFELLTQQYELAKVQEAKEIPSVKVLDQAVAATVKSSPHRTVISMVGTILIVCAAGYWILLRKKWKDVDPSDPGKVLAEEMAGAVAGTARKFATSAASVGAAMLARRRNARKAAGEVVRSES
jgi:uncharacterized protein involved in exopolysaccharide biosynthesis